MVISYNKRRTKQKNQEKEWKSCRTNKNKNRMESAGRSGMLKEKQTERKHQ